MPGVLGAGSLGGCRPAEEDSAQGSTHKSTGEPSNQCLALRQQLQALKEQGQTPCQEGCGLASNQRSGDFTFCDLAGLPLDCLNFQEQNLTGMVLGPKLNENGVLQQSVEPATVEHTNFAGVTLDQAVLNRVDFRKSSLQYLERQGEGGAEYKALSFKGAQLLGANLTDLAHLNAEKALADFAGANLSGADLNYADLNYANLSGADLNYADLNYANLSGAHLRGAHLRGAHLRGANLSGANLRGADLDYADLRGVVYDSETIWPLEYTPPASR